MSGTSHQPPRIGLDARAAELKEKLLRGRSQSRSQSQTRASPVRPEGTPVAVAPAPSAQTSFVPHEAPRPPAATSLDADANDIAALISSISSAADEDPGVFAIPGLNVNGLGASQPKPKPTAQQSLPANIQSRDAEPKPPAQQAAPTPHARAPASLPPKPTSKVYIPAPSKPTPKVQTQQPQQPPEPSQAQSTASATEAPKGGARVGDGSPEEGEVSTTSTIPPSPLGRPQPVARSNSHQEHVRKASVTKPTEPIARNSPRRDSEGKPQPAASKQPAPASAKPTELPKAANKTTNASRATTNGQKKSQSTAETVPKTVPKAVPEPVLSDEQALTRLLAQLPDIKDWLELTDYHNVEIRTRKLDRFRRAKALAAERLRIEEEERKLMEEEELEMGLRRTTVARVTSAVSSAPTVSETGNSLPTPITPTVAADAANNDTPPIAQPPKRPHDEDGAEAREEKIPRLEEPTPRSEQQDEPRPREDEQKPREDDHRSARPDDRRPSGPERADARPRASSPYRRPHPPSSPRRHDYRRSSPSPPTRLRDYSPHRQPRHHDDYDSRGRKYDRYSGDRNNDKHYPIPVDLGHDGETRYFILKSFNEENVRSCMEDNLWTTQVHVGRTLAEAFAKCKNVILFFSINKSRAFQGYARMISPPSPTTPKPRWVRSIHWDTSEPFRVRWLSTTPVEFYRVGHLKNALNEGAAVLVGKDGQEIEGGCGAELLREMEIASEMVGGVGLLNGSGSASGVRPEGGSRGGGGGGGGGYGHGYGGGRKRFVKREGEDDRRY